MTNAGVLLPPGLLAVITLTVRLPLAVWLIALVPRLLATSSLLVVLLAVLLILLGTGLLAVGVRLTV